MTATTDHTHPDDAAGPPSGAGGLKRRSFIGYVLGGTTLIAAADMALASPAAQALPSAPSIPELYDLNDFLTDAAAPTSALIKITINTDGTASFALPRSENGQGIVDSTAMIIADELDVDVYLADPLMRVGSVARRGNGSELSVHRCAAAVSVGLTLLASS